MYVRTYICVCICVCVYIYIYIYVDGTCQSSKTDNLGEGYSDYKPPLCAGT